MSARKSNELYCYNSRVEKGYNFAILGPTENKIRVRLFFVLMLYIKFQVPSSSGPLDIVGTSFLQKVNKSGNI